MAPADAAPSRTRRWLPVFGVVLVIVVVTLGGWITAAALVDDLGPVRSAEAGITVDPLEGWDAEPLQADGVSGLRLTSGTGTLDVLVAPYDGDEATLLAEYRQRFLEPDSSQLRVATEAELVEAASGETGLRVTYVGIFGDRGTPVEGEVTAVVTGGSGAIFDGWGAQGQFAAVRDEIRTMIEGSKIR